MKFYLVYEDHLFDDMSAVLIGIFLNENTAIKCMEIRMEEEKDVMYWGEEHYLDILTPEIYKDPDICHCSDIPLEYRGKILTQKELSRFEWSRSNGKRPKSLTEQLMNRGVKKERFEVAFKGSEWVVGVELTDSVLGECNDIWIFNLKDDFKTEPHSCGWDLQYEKNDMEEILSGLIEHYKELEREQWRKRYQCRQED